MENVYKTKDIGLASALMTVGEKLIEVSREGRICWFVFEGLDDCLKIDKEYWFGNLLVNAKIYKQNLDQLKGLIHN